MGTVFRLTGDSVIPTAGARLIRAADYARLVEARDLLAAAHERADAIRVEAEAA